MTDMILEITETVGTLTVSLDPDSMELELGAEPVVVALPITTQESVEILSAGPAGAPGPAGSTYVHTQTTPASTWVIEHNLNTILSVVLILDSDPTTAVFSDVEYPDLNTVIVTLPTAVAGKAYLR